MMKVRRVPSRNQSESDLRGWIQKRLRTIAFVCCYTASGTLGTDVGGCWLRTGAAVNSLPRSSAQAVPGAGLCSVLGAPRQKEWFCGSRAPSSGKRGHRGTAVTKGLHTVGPT